VDTMLAITDTDTYISGIPCRIGRMEGRKLGENFKGRVWDKPNALVKPKIEK